MLNPAQIAQMTRQQRLAIMKAKQRHPSWDVETIFLSIVNSDDMIKFNNEVEARLTGGAEV